MALKEGDVLAGKYRVERQLGEGGMGAVFIATNTVLQRQVALKVMTGSFALVPAAVERFHREAIAASRVSHPSIVQVFDAGNHEGQPWIAMELLDGESLGDRLMRGPLSLDEVMMMARGALSALAEVHEQGIVHRDLKPDNIFLAKNKSGGFTPKVLDFGVAKDTSSEQLNKLTATGAVVGTAYYLSPEQAKGAPNIDARADVYAMGVVLFECLSGNMPYEADTITQLIAKMFTESPRSLAEVAPHIPSPIADVVTTCLQQNPVHRYQGARELLQALEQAVAVSTGQAAPAMAYAGTMQGIQNPGSHPGVMPPGTPAPLGMAGTAVGHMPGGQVPSAPGFGHTGPGVVAPSHPGLGMGSHPGMPPGSQPGVPMGSQPGFPGTAAGMTPMPMLQTPHPMQQTPHPMHQTAYMPPGAVPPVGTAPGYASPAPAQESGGGKGAMIAIVAVLFLLGAAGTGGVAWMMMSDGGDAVASAEDTTAASPPTTVAPPDPVPAPPPTEAAPNDAVAQEAQGEAADGEGDEAEAVEDDGEEGSTRSRRSRRRGPDAPANESDEAAPAENENEAATPAATPTPPANEAARPAPEPAPQRRPQDIPGITPQAIAAAINGRMPYARERCFERRRRRVPNLGGIVTIGFRVRPDGRADDVNVVHNGSGDEWFGRCIGNVVRGTRFPEARNGHDTPARYPFRF